jgi:hypothetical protein
MMSGFHDLRADRRNLMPAPDGVRPPDNGAGSSLSGMSNRTPLKCGRTLAVTTNPKVK